jgi:hypothetical protein
MYDIMGGTRNGLLLLLLLLLQCALLLMATKVAVTTTHLVKNATVYDRSGGNGDGAFLFSQP